MEGDQISARQLYGMLFTGLLTPAVRALPVLTAAVADKSAWLLGCWPFRPCSGLVGPPIPYPKGQGGSPAASVGHLV